MNPDPAFECNAPDVVLENFGDEAVILNLQTGSYYSLDGVGMFYWEHLSRGVPSRQIASHITGRYADPVAVTGDLDQLLAQFQAEGLIRSSKVVRAMAEITCTAELPAEYARPVLSKFDDVADMLLLDPVHDVSEVGWPHPPAAPGGEPGRVK
jgi:hypothetical protein